ncbi:putative MFS family arabinose efflux permease [Bradyrhizobium macuxiense]|uniref:Putative MFS family arabinose efflux permease n=1 Tax=Bradyrhizobium macuxiense TaxID=1755647 RepID=A0A560M4I5_9BRAD|nr:MFS transporter [Bradyrhizobium macuxiense]TWC00581.1 putative MFS family arabinose efflux permease [Bradyrhizobium macuxiense]
MSVFWLALGAFAIGTEAFVIAGLLPAIAADVQISAAAAGQLVTAYALTYAIGSPVLAVMLNNIDRRTVLTLALSVFIVGNLLATVAWDFPVLLASRIVMALGAGLCMPTAIGVSVAVASPERRGRAVALVTSGITVATVIGVPFGNVVGSLLGWRATFAMVALLGLIALAGLAFGLPRGLPRSTANLAERLAVARHRAVLAALVITILWAVGGFTVFTYLAIPLHQQLGFDASGVSLALFAFGSAAAIGNMTGGLMADRIGATSTAALGLAGMASALILQSFVLKYVAPDQAGHLVLLLIFLWGISGWAFYPPQIASIIHINPQASAIALSLNASAMYLGFAIGGATGGLVLSTASPTDLGWVGGTSVAMALAVHLFRSRRERLNPYKIAG